MPWSELITDVDKRIATVNHNSAFWYSPTFLNQAYYLGELNEAVACPGSLPYVTGNFQQVFLESQSLIEESSFSGGTPVIGDDRINNSASACGLFSTQATRSYRSYIGSRSAGLRWPKQPGPMFQNSLGYDGVKPDWLQELSTDPETNVAFYYTSNDPVENAIRFFPDYANVRNPYDDSQDEPNPFLRVRLRDCIVYAKKNPLNAGDIWADRKPPTPGGVLDTAYASELLVVPAPSDRHMPQYAYNEQISLNDSLPAYVDLDVSTPSLRAEHLIYDYDSSHNMTMLIRMSSLHRQASIASDEIPTDPLVAGSNSPYTEYNAPLVSFKTNVNVLWLMPPYRYWISDSPVTGPDTCGWYFVARRAPFSPNSTPIFTVFDGTTLEVLGDSPLAQASIGTQLAYGDRIIYLGDFIRNRVALSDVTGPYSLRSTISSSDPYFTNGVINLQVSGNYLYVRGYDHVTVVDVANKSNPVFVGQVSHDVDGTGNYVAFPDTCQMVLNGSNLFLTDEVNGQLAIIDVQNPVNPFYTGSRIDVDTDEGTHGLAVEDGYAYVSSWAKLTVVDVSNPSSMSIVTTLGSSLLAAAGHLVKSGNYVYVACGGVFPAYQSYLVIVDVSTPSSPSVVGSLPLGNSQEYAWDITVLGNRAWLTLQNRSALANDLVAVVDVSSPESPAVVSYLPLAGVTHVLGVECLTLSFGIAGAQRDSFFAFKDYSGS
jgi:hypothetical protein